MGLFRIESEHFGGECKVISSSAFDDERGFFSVPFRKDEFAKLGLPTEFVQDNHSCSRANVIRGLHFQLGPPMGKLMRVTRGRAWLVTVDIRYESPTFLQWWMELATPNNRIQVWAPHRFARGFCSIEDNTEVQYKCTAMFDPEGDKALAWNDPDIGIPWPIEDPKNLLISEKDRNAPTVAQWLGK
jgi:dTDP-4-dehydrorhamnose 3,5-epimerase